MPASEGRSVEPLRSTYIRYGDEQEFAPAVREHAERFKNCDDIGANERNDERSGAGKNARESE